MTDTGMKVTQLKEKKKKKKKEENILEGSSSYFDLTLSLSF